jgi:hypothetical protein
VTTIALDRVRRTAWTLACPRPLARLYEPRVRRILEPMIAGEALSPDSTFDDDVSYVRDLGLIANDKPARVANPIYREVIVRVLGSVTDEQDFDRLLREFADFWR